MKKNNNWSFIQRPGRPPLSRQDADSIIMDMDKTLKCGIEFEWNLPDTPKGCSGDNPSCVCKNKTTIEGIDCNERCSCHGKCEIEKTSGCPASQIYCVMFVPGCAKCDKFDIGCSTCPKKRQQTETPDEIRQRVFNTLDPTKFLGSLGKSGVLDVTTDGSLQGGKGGMEVITVGRRVNFYSIYNMCKNIMDTAKPYGIFVNERCSIHFHLLIGYLSNSNEYNKSRPNYGLAPRSGPEQARTDGNHFEIRDMERDIPETVLANFHQLWRMFEPAIVWMTSSGTSREHLTRWIKFRRSLSKYSAFRSSMSTIMEEIRKDGDNQRYTMVNYTPTKIDSMGNISRFHIEVRVCDGMLSPAAVSSFACLFYGMLLKAVDISRYGIVESGNKEYMDKVRSILGYLCNNDGGYGGPRHSDTSKLDPYITDLIGMSKNLLRLVGPYLTRQGNSLDILTKLAEAPISIRLSDNHSWEDIERELVSVEEGPNKTDIIKSEILKAACLGIFTDCSSIEEWACALSEDIKLDRTEIAKQINTLAGSGEVFWSDSRGSVIKR